MLVEFIRRRVQDKRGEKPQKSAPKLKWVGSLKLKVEWKVEAYNKRQKLKKKPKKQVYKSFLLVVTSKKENTFKKNFHLILERFFGKGSRFWNYSIEESIRIVFIFGIPLRVGDFLALDDGIYLLSFSLFLFMVLYLFDHEKH